jgi:hypothetical protein
MNKIKALFAILAIAIISSTGYGQTQSVVQVQAVAPVKTSIIDAAINSTVIDYTTGASKPVGEDSTLINSFGVNTVIPLFKDIKFQLGGDITIREDGNQYDSTFGFFTKKEKFSIAALIDYRRTAYENDLFSVRPIVGYNLNEKISFYGVGRIHLNTDTTANINEQMMDRGDLHVTYLTDNRLLIDGSIGYIFNDVTETVYGLSISKALKLVDIFAGGEIDNAGNYVVNCGVALGLGERYARHSTVYNANPNSPFPKYSSATLLTDSSNTKHGGKNGPPPPPNLVTVCYKGETIQILTKDLKKYLANGATLGSCNEPPPPPTEVTICYKGATITILSTQLAWYLSHGATVGQCSIEPPPPGGDHKITLCHKGRTISVDLHSARAHLAHGDTLGPCQE